MRQVKRNNYEDYCLNNIMQPPNLDPRH